MLDRTSQPAVLQYRASGDFLVVRPGTFVFCAVTGARIPLEELRYWSEARQEAYVDGQAAAQRLGADVWK
jgi:hypothetical protein